MRRFAALALDPCWKLFWVRVFTCPLGGGAAKGA